MSSDPTREPHAATVDLLTQERDAFGERMHLIESRGASREQAFDGALRELLASRLRLAQGLRVIRDTGTEFDHNVAERALVEAGVLDPEDDDGCC